MNKTEKRILEIVTHLITYPASRVATCIKWFEGRNCGDYYIPELDLTARVWISLETPTDSKPFHAVGCTIKL